MIDYLDAVRYNKINIWRFDFFNYIYHKMMKIVRKTCVNNTACRKMSSFDFAKQTEMDA